MTFAARISGFLLNVENSFKSVFSQQNRRAAVEKIQRVALEAFKILVAVGLFLINPSLFTIGFVAGIVLNKQCKEAVQKIVSVYKKHPWKMTLTTIVGGFLSLPVALATASLVYSAYIGSELSS